jgi:hypothetical protein
MAKALGGVAVSLVTIVAVLFIESLVVSMAFPRLSRVTTDFSPAYFSRVLQSIASEPPGSETIFLGDSVLWGYGLQSPQTAIAILQSRGCACINLAFKAGSPANYYAIAKLIVAKGIRPRAVVIEVNQKLFNAADDWYKALHPAIAALATPILDSGELSDLSPPPAESAAQQWLDRHIAPIWLPYAMRSDIKETLFGDDSALPVQAPTADAFLGTYDLSKLDEENVGVKYLEKTVELLHASGIPVVAFMTPTNHVLLHDYIDVPEYRANGSYVKRLLERRGAYVIDLDRAFPAHEFLDEVHLTPEGQKRMAAILGDALSRAGVLVQGKPGGS